MLKKVLFLFTLASVNLFAKTNTLSPTDSLERLKAGNHRFVTETLEHPDRSSERRAELQNNQAPFAIVLSCSDSRVSPEIIFDAGLGDLFIIRVAGNVLGPTELESIKYSVLANRSSLILVLGHENCGAIQAVLQNKTQDIETIAELIEPAILESNSLESAITDNVNHIVNALKSSPILSQFISLKALNIVGGYYHFETGVVDFIE
jgi:carbonic anhydrase